MSWMQDIANSVIAEDFRLRRNRNMRRGETARAARLRWRDAGLCRSCGEPLAEGSAAYCVPCRDAQRARDRRRGRGYNP